MKEMGEDSSGGHTFISSAIRMSGEEEKRDNPNVKQTNVASPSDRGTLPHRTPGKYKKFHGRAFSRRRERQGRLGGFFSDVQTQPDERQKRAEVD